MDSGVRREPSLHIGMLVCGVVVHDQVRLLVGVGAGEVAEEDQELLVSVPRFAHAGDLVGGDFECGEQAGGAVPDVVVGAFLGLPGLHRQRLLGRFNAWIWDFLSMLSTIAFSGGCRYSPTTSVTLATNSQSVENLNLKVRSATAAPGDAARSAAPSRHPPPDGRPAAERTNASHRARPAAVSA
jgi:hypothetical protein